MLSRRAIAPPACIGRVKILWGVKPSSSTMAVMEMQRAVVMSVDLIVVHRLL